MGGDYWQIDAGFLKNHKSEQAETGGNLAVSDDKLSYLDLGFFFKYPFELGPISFAPMAGLSLKLNLRYTDANGNNLKTDSTRADLNQTWIKVGVGADVDLSNNFYLRVMALLGYRLRTERVRNNQEYLENRGVSTSYSGLGFDLSAGFGFRF